MTNLDHEKHELALDNVDAVFAVRVQRFDLRHAALFNDLALERRLWQVAVQLFEGDLHLFHVLVEHPDLQ